MQSQMLKLNLQVSYGQDNLGDSPQTFIEGGVYFGTVNAKEKLQEYKANTNGLADDYKIVIVLQANGDTESGAFKLKEFFNKMKENSYQNPFKGLNITVQAMGYQFVCITLQLAEQSLQQQAHGFIKFLTVGQPTLYAKNNYLDFGIQFGNSVQQVFASENPLATMFEAHRTFINANFDRDFPSQMISTYIDFMPQEVQNLLIPLSLFKSIKWEIIEGGTNELEQDLLNILKDLLPQFQLQELRKNLQEKQNEQEKELFKILLDHFEAKGNVYVNSPIGAGYINFSLQGFSKFFYE